MDAPLALYRRYRPETFAEVIGQEHVTEPLRAALAANRVNHAYLFSGPRGCGKTTSARILARTLNCELAPIADPCGVCRSCVDLARGGPGSIDVIEIDAASHGGVDDARDLREKAFFAPVASRYKIYVIDEAHMVTTQGFNALLKLVEEPPPHLRFVFATTEPDKVIPTIRSRTHHYPFRLIPPRLLSGYLTELCDKEGVRIEPAALPLVVRAGAGSARDTLSVLDQLLGGAGPDGVTHALATGLLGYTPDTLLDDVVDAFAANDGAAVFGVVDKVIETGQDPRRFTEDLLRRLRDLVIVAAVPDAPATGLLDVSQDQGQRLVAQAGRFGRADLSRAADLVAAGLTEMRGATAPRLLLELILARVLLPGADHTTQGVLARLDRIERRAAITGVTSAETTPAPARAPETDRSTPAEPAPVAEPEPEAFPDSAPPVVESERTRRAAPAAEPEPERAPDPTPEPAPARPVQVMPVPDPTSSPSAPASAPAAASAPAESGGLGLVEVRRLWPDLVEACKQRRRVTWMHLTNNAQVVAVDGRTLTLGFVNAGARESFDAGGHAEILRQSAIDVVGADWRIETIVDPGADPSAPPPPSTVPSAAPATSSAPARSAAVAPPVPAPTAEPVPGPSDDAPPPWAADDPAADEPAPDEPAPEDPWAGAPVSEAGVSRSASSAARQAIRETRGPGSVTGAAGHGRQPGPTAGADADVSPDDVVVAPEDTSQEDLLARHLGAKVIEEISHQ